MHIREVEDKTILYAALDWGFGHVTRSIGIIRQLLRQGNTVIVACNAEQRALFASYLPDLIYESLEGYNFRFSGTGNWSLDLWKQRASFFEAIERERARIEELLEKYPADLVVSDHRYGFRSGRLPSVFITHQLHLPLSWTFFPVQRWHERQLRKFDSLWVPDEENNPLAGKLSHPVKHPGLNYIGWYSRFENENRKQTAKGSSAANENKEEQYDYLLVLSGPKPYSEQLLEEAVVKTDFSGKKVAVLHPASLELKDKNPDFAYFPATSLKENDHLFRQSACIISRSGYSTLMDLKFLQKKAILIPTKGQKEQEYLAEIQP